MRKKHSGEFKAKVAMEAMQAGARLNELAAKYQVHPNQVAEWKKHLMTNAVGLFAKKSDKEAREREAREEEYLKIIGMKESEINFLKKNLKKLGLI